MKSTPLCVYILAFGALLVLTQSYTPFEWMRPDRFDEVNDKFFSITQDNCRGKRAEDLHLRDATVPQKPLYNKLLSSVIYSNRSNLLHAHNMALNRAFFYSFIYQHLNHTYDFDTQPGMMYIYMGHAADVSANPGFINGSAIFFDNNCSYPNFFRKLSFNTTLPLFGPRAWREDDYNEPTNWLREPTNNTIDIHDYGSGIMRNYTHPEYKANPWYKPWLPDLIKKKDSVRKFTYSVGIKYSNTTGVFIKDEFTDYSFFGPPQPGQQADQDALPVLISQPYFDCGKSNRWIVSASSPVVEFMPRYTRWVHEQRARFVGVITMDVEFERIDMNQCPIAEGNPSPNYFAGTARCRPTTMCEPLMGFGFRRGGYMCVCLPGYYYPWWHDGPFMGLEIEQSTYEEFENGGFDCLAVEHRQDWPVKDPMFVTRKRRSIYTARHKFMDALPKRQSVRLTPREKRSVIETVKAHKAQLKAVKEGYATNHPRQIQKRSVAPAPAKPVKIAPTETHHRQKRDARVDEEAATRLRRIMDRKYQTNSNNCGSKKAYELFLPGDVNFGVERLFEPQGRTALRLAHFLSNFLQNVDEYEEFGDLKGDRRLNETQIFAEVLSNVMSDFRIMGSGVFFDRYKFRMSPPINNTDPRFVNGITREFFGPYAWRKTTDQAGLDSFQALDYAGFKDYYSDKPWFQNVKSRWGTNFYDLKKFTAKPMIRSDYNGTSSIRFEYYPLTYRAATYEDGEWLRPQFKCDGQVDDWVITYLAPIFGKNDLKTRIEFKGVVTVDVSMDYLDINQCPDNFYTANAFKNTARCDYKTQYCFPLEGKRFSVGGYKCECRQGFEYPFTQQAWYFDGQMMEEEHRKLRAGEPNRYALLRCRVAAAPSLTASIILVVAMAAMQFLW